MEKQKRHVSGRTVLLCIVLFFVLDRALSIGLFLPGFCVEDERWVRNAAVRMVTELEYNPGTHKYPGLMPELTALFYLGSYMASNYRALFHFESLESLAWDISHYSFDFVSTIALGRLLVVILGAVAIALFFVYVKREFGVTPALIGSLFMCTSPAFLFSTQLLKNDVLVVMGVLLTLFASLAMAKSDRTRYHVMGGLAFGFCMAAKYHLPAVVPLLVAHRLQRKELSFVKAFFTWRLAVLVFFSAAGFALLSPATLADLPGAFHQAMVELAIQNRFDPLFRRSPDNLLHLPVLFIFAAVLPLSLGLLLYLVSLVGLFTRTSFKTSGQLITWSYPAAFLVFMIALSELGAPHLYTPVTPFFALLAALVVAPLLDEENLIKRAAAIVVIGVVAGSNLAFMHSLNYYEDFVLRKSVESLEQKAGEGGSLALVPYYPNPDKKWETRFVPQPFLSKEKLAKESPERVLVHHAFYRAYGNNKLLLENPKVRKMYRSYLLLRLGSLGYREEVRFTEHGLEGDSAIFMGSIYKRLMPDLEGIEASIYVKADEN